ncbi:MAG: hypothetical protein FJ333_08360 [Sphingomonadales bacterium]|nr:hypothetical protein [Sphingomonadales bacterium]
MKRKEIPLPLQQIEVKGQTVSLCRLKNLIDRYSGFFNNFMTFWPILNSAKIIREKTSTPKKEAKKSKNINSKRIKKLLPNLASSKRTATSKSCKSGKAKKGLNLLAH